MKILSKFDISKIDLEKEKQQQQFFSFIFELGKNETMTLSEPFVVVLIQQQYLNIFTTRIRL